MSKLTEKRLSFGELSTQEDNALYNSNMLNLVSATKNIEKELRILERKKKILEDNKKEILAYAEGGEDAILNTTKVAELFNKAAKESQLKDERW